MKHSLSRCLCSSALPTTTEQQRRRLVTMALNLTASTPLAPTAYEQMLLDQFVRGNLTIEQVLDFLK